jgi:hypothetical protein
MPGYPKAVNAATATITILPLLITTPPELAQDPTQDLLEIPS